MTSCVKLPTVVDSVTAPASIESHAHQRTRIEAELVDTGAVKLHNGLRVRPRAIEQADEAVVE